MYKCMHMCVTNDSGYIHMYMYIHVHGTQVSCSFCVCVLALFGCGVLGLGFLSSLRL